MSYLNTISWIGVCGAFSLAASASPPLVCASGGAVGTIDLEVVSPSRNATHPLPFRTIARLEEGDTIRYRPVLRPHEVRKGEVTLVLVPANKKAVGRDKVLIFAPRAAAHVQEWSVPWRTSLVAFVYGPSGLNEKKVATFLDRDDDFVGELADYADKTAKSEALIAALSAQDSSREAVAAALDGFSSKFGAAAPLSKTAPTSQQATVMFQTLNPSIAAYDPLAGQGTQPVGQTAGIATSVAEMFFGTPVGLAAGGTALLMNLRAMAFPKSEFRSAYSQPMPEDSLGLCGKNGSGAVHTRVAYLWAVRIPNADAPKLTVGSANSILPGTKSPLPLTGNEWANLDRAKNWTLQPDNGVPIPVKIQVMASSKSIELNLDKQVKPGRYSLSATWDWDHFDVGGFLYVRPVPDFRVVKLTPEAHDRLVAATGKQVLTLEGTDFEFLTKLELKKINDKFATASTIPFVLPQGLRSGVQNRVDMQVDTSNLELGGYQLKLSQMDGKSNDIELTVLPEAPVLENLPLKINADTKSASIQLKGKRLDLLRDLKIPGVVVTLGAASADGGERQLAVQIKSSPAPGAKLALHALVTGRIQPMDIADAMEIIGPRPSIEAIELSSLPQQSVRLEPGELPTGLTISTMMRVTNLRLLSSVTLGCEGMAGGALTLRSDNTHLKRLTSDQLFLTFDSNTWTNGCALQAAVQGDEGGSAPSRIGRIIEVPSIEDFKLVPQDEHAADATIVGRNLETIGKAGWSPEQAIDVTELPQPLSGDGRQKLQVHLSPPPSQDATLYVWLRGDMKARITNIRAN